MANLLKRHGKVQETPELKIAKADTHIEAAQSQFDKMIAEATLAIEKRNEAVSELDKEIVSLEATLRGKKEKLMEANAKNSADYAFIERIKELAGK